MGSYRISLRTSVGPSRVLKAVAALQGGLSFYFLGAPLAADVLTDRGAPLGASVLVSVREDEDSVIVSLRPHSAKVVGVDFTRLHEEPYSRTNAGSASYSRCSSESNAASAASASLRESSRPDH